MIAMVNWRKAIAPLLLSIVLFLTSCATQTPSRFDQAQKESTRRGAPAAVAKTAEQGSTFNQFFPSGPRGYEVIPTQEKKGFAEYKVLKDGVTLAMLSISDTSSVPSAAAKYQLSTFQVGNYPAVDQGTTATGLLINDRYQVKVLSRDPSFTREDRIDWLQKFDLRGLAKLEPAVTAKAPLLPKANAPVPQANPTDKAAPIKRFVPSPAAYPAPTAPAAPSQLPPVVAPQPAA